jgi:hypothetical protein
LERIRSRRLERGITTAPRWTDQRKSTWAGVRPSRDAIPTTLGWSSAPPRSSGLYASRTIPLRSQKSRTPPEVEGAEVHLVDRGWDALCDEPAEQVGPVVADADRPREAALPQREQIGPAARGAQRHRPVDQVQVDVGEPEPVEAAGELAARSAYRRHPLRGHEQLLAGEAAARDRGADGALVPVHRRGVDVAVARLERPLHRLLGLAAPRRAATRRAREPASAPRGRGPAPACRPAPPLESAVGLLARARAIYSWQLRALT